MSFGLYWFFGSWLYCFTPQLFSNKVSPCFEDNEEASKAGLFNIDEDFIEDDHLNPF